MLYYLERLLRQIFPSWLITDDLPPVFLPWFSLKSLFASHAAITQTLREETTASASQISDGKPSREYAAQRITSVSDVGIIRRLGCLESYQTALQNLDQMRAYILTCRYHLPASLHSDESDDLLISTIENAVADVVLRHPSLHVGLVGENTDEPCWVRLHELDLRNHIDWQIIKGCPKTFENVLRSVLETQLDTKFNNHKTTPGWRIKVLHHRGTDFLEIILAINHAYMDGTGAKIFHKELLQSLHQDVLPLDKQILNDHILKLPENSTLRLNPPAESFTHFPVDEGAMQYYLKEEVGKPASEYPSRSTQAQWALIQPSPFRTKFYTIEVPNAILLKLLRACRSHKTSLTGLLHGLALASLAPLLGPSEAAAFESLTAMDQRPMLPSRPSSHPWLELNTAMSNYVTILNHIFNEDTVNQLRSRISSHGSESDSAMDLVWVAAAQVRRALEVKMQQGLNNDLIGFAQAVSDWRAQLTEQAKKPRGTSWVVTNLGMIDGMPLSSLENTSQTTPENAWAITRSQFILGTNVAASAIGISIAAVKGGDLVISCSWQECVIDPKIGEAFVRNMERWLDFTSQFADGCATSEND